jgi:hypothetical protein
MMNLGCSGPQRGLVAKEGIAANNDICCPNDGGKSAGPAGTMTTSGSIGIAEENGVVKVEGQLAGGPTEKTELPRRRKLALQDEQIRAAELLPKPEAGKPATRPQS